MTIQIGLLLGIIGVSLVLCSFERIPADVIALGVLTVLILIGSMLGVGSALEYTGVAKFLANEIVAWMGHANPLWLLSGFFVLTMLLTQPMSNQAAAVVVVPVA